MEVFLVVVVKECACFLLQTYIWEMQMGEDFTVILKAVSGQRPQLFSMVC